MKEASANNSRSTEARSFHIITGCSGGGKSTLLSELEKRGYRVFPEPGRMNRTKRKKALPKREVTKLNDIEIQHLKTAIAVAWRAREHGNHPFGAVLVDDHNQVILEAENTVATGRDSTGHAETNLVRLATREFSPEQLVHCTLYSSTEPCAMGAGAIYWSQIGRVVYALSEMDLYDIIGPSPDHLLLPCREVFAHSERHIEVLGPIPLLDSEARAVHKGFWTTSDLDHPT
jgi:tRNA(Arg) A34 adenosine deaminase TadA